MHKIDCSGLACPKPVLKAKDFIENNPNDSFQLIVDNKAAKENVSRFLDSRGWEIQVEEEEGRFIITASPPETCPVCEIMSDSLKQSEKILVIIPTNVMGKGDDRLGSSLMKNFIATLKEMGEDLWRIILLNGGVKLAVEGSEVIEDLKALERDNIDILVCGTCLDFYGLLDKKQVGTTTNMLDIVTSMQVATKVIRI